MNFESVLVKFTSVLEQSKQNFNHFFIPAEFVLVCSAINNYSINASDVCMLIIYGIPVYCSLCTHGLIR